MSKFKLKRVISIVLLIALFVTSVGLQDVFFNNNDGLEAEVKKSDEDWIGHYSDSIPEVVGIGCINLKGKYGSGGNITVSSSLKSNLVKEDEYWADWVDDSEKKDLAIFQIRNPKLTEPAVDKDLWMKIANCGYMQEGDELVKIDCKMYFGSNHKKGTFVKVHKDKSYKISFGGCRGLWNQTIKKGGKTYKEVTGKEFWGTDNANAYGKVKQNNLLIEFEFFKAGTSTKISNPSGVLYFSDCDKGEGWGVASPGRSTPNNMVYFKNDKNYMVYTKRKVGGSTYKMFTGDRVYLGSPMDLNSVGFSFKTTASKNLKLVYDAVSGFRSSPTPGNLSISYHIVNKDNNLPKKANGTTYSRSELEPDNFNFVSHTVINKNSSTYKSLVNFYEKVPGYKFSGWKVGSISGKAWDAGGGKPLTSSIDLYGEYKSIQLEASVSKVWDDSNNSAQVRPSSLKFDLYKKVGSTETSMGKSVTLSSTNNWKDSVNVDVGADGANADFYWKENASDTGYKSKSSKTFTKGDPYVLNQTFTNSLDLVNLTVSKSWSGDTSSERPSSVAVNVKRKYGNTVDNFFSKSVTLTSSGSWRTTVNNLPLLVNSSGTTCTYYVEEPNPPTGYSATVSNGSVSGTGKVKTQTCSITNTKAATIDITVKKTWSDSGYSTNRPSSVSYVLYKTIGTTKTRVGAGVLNSSNGWTSVHSNLAYESNASFSVEETAPSGYSVSYSKSSVSTNGSKRSQTITINNSISTSTYGVRISWVEDVVVGTTMRPSSVTVALYKGSGSSRSFVKNVTLSSSNNWSYTESLPPGTYTWQQGAVKAYSSSQSTSGNTTTITNRISGKTLTVKKVWDSTCPSNHPTSVEFKAYYTLDGVRTTYATRNLSSSNGYTYSVPVPVLYNSNGTECTYEVVETVPSGYVASYSVSGNTTTITNSLSGPGAGYIEVEHEWADNFPEYLKKENTYEIGAYIPYRSNIYILQYDPVKFTEPSRRSEYFYASTGYTDINGYDYGFLEASTVDEYLTKAVLYANTSSSSGLGSLVSHEVIKVGEGGGYSSGGYFVKSLKYKVITKFNGNPYVNISVQKKWNMYDESRKYKSYVWLKRRLKGTSNSWEDVPGASFILLSGDKDWKLNFTNVERYNSLGQEYEFSLTESPANSSDPNLSYKTGVSTIDRYLADNSQAFNTTVSSMSPYTVVDSSTVKAEFVITSTQNKYATVHVTKDWKNMWDSSYKPSSVTASVSVSYHDSNGRVQSGTVGQVTLNADNNWSADITGLPLAVNDGGNKTLAYSATENVTSDIRRYFTVSNSSSAYGTSVNYGTRFDNVLTNTLKDKNKITVAIKKDWQMPYGVVEKPQKIQVQLYAYKASNNQPLVGTYELSEANGWQVVVPNLEVGWEYKDGTATTDHYYVREVTDSDFNSKFTASYSTTNISTTGTVTITNTEKQMRKIHISKVWNDVNNRDNLRPQQITATVNGSSYAPSFTKSVVLNAQNGWSADVYAPFWGTSTSYPAQYSVSETVPSGYVNSIEWNESPSTTSYRGDYNVTITNTHTPSKGSVSAVFRKVWNVSSGVYGSYTYPASLSVDLVRTNSKGVSEVVQSRTVQKQNTNTYTTTMSSLPALDDNYEPYSYEWVERTELPGFVSSSETVLSGSTYTTTVTNTAQTVNVNIYSTWDDGHDKDGLRPKTQTVRNTKGYPVNVSVSEANSWEHHLSNLPGVSTTDLWGGFTANTPEGYTTSVKVYTSGNEVDVYVSNVHASSYVTATVRKVWDDTGHTSERPVFVSADLYRIEDESDNIEDLEPVASCRLSAENNWQEIIDSLPSNGIEGEYVFVEREMGDPNNEDARYPNYKTTTVNSQTDTGYQTLITNKYVAPPTTSATVRKVWSDNNNSAGYRPSSVQVQLYKGLNAVGDPITLNSSNNWTVTKTGLPLIGAETADEYTFYELNTPDRYTDSISRSGTTTTITNTYAAPEYVSATARVTWGDGSTNKSVQVQLVQDGVTYIGSPITLSSSNSYTCTINNLDKSSAGVDHTYSFIELDPPSGYVPSYTSTKSGSTFITTISNQHNVPVVSATAKKVWSDSNDVDELRPSSVMVQLVRNTSINVGSPVELSEDNNWEYTVSNLPATVDGSSCSYSYKELNVSSGYSATYSTSSGVTTVTNTHNVIPKTSVTVRVAWQDNNDVDKVRPSTVEVALFRNGTEIDSFDVSSREGWQKTISDLPTQVDGRSVSYSFRVNESPYGYSSTSSVSGSTTTFTNTHTPVTRKTFTVKKVWNDESNIDNIRPSQVRINMLRNGQQYRSITLDSSNNWQYSESNLPITEMDGTTEINYSFKEAAVPSGYSVSYSTSSGITTVTNTHEVVRKLTVTKKVLKSDVHEPFTSPSFVFKLTGTNTKGEDVEYRQMLKPELVQTDGNYLIATYTWESLKLGNYVLEELPVDRYELADITDLNGVVKEGNRARINFVSNGAKDSASVTFVNALSGYEEYTHTDSSSEQLK